MRPTFRQPLASLSFLLIGFGVGLFFTPKKVISQSKTVETTNSQIAKTENKANKTTKIETVKPDGTKVITVIEDRSVTTENKAISSKTEIKEKTKIVENKKQPSWMISGQAGTQLTDPGIRSYGGAIQKRILGPFWVGVYGDSRGNIGGMFSVQF